jgi:hypothetical protein
VRWVNESSASGVSGSADLNTIPLAIIDRIEVLEDGAAGEAVLVIGDRGYRCRRCVRHTSQQVAVLSREALAFLRASASTAPGQISRLMVPDRALEELETAHHMLMSTHLEKELKSFRVLQELRERPQHERTGDMTRP